LQRFGAGMATRRRLVRRLAHHIRDHGLAATAHRVWTRLRRSLHLRESHAWSVLDVATAAAPPPLAGGLVIVRGGRSDVGLLADLPTEVSAAVALRRLAGGAQLWLVKDGSRAAFVCWIFPQALPAVAAPGGQLELPPGFAALEDTATSEDYRGRGIAPAAWLAIAERLERDGYTHILTKVEVDNAPSRRAVAKAGFREVALVHLVRRAWHRHVTVEVLSNGGAGRMLRDRLATGGPRRG
jgi:GNAT superfamily N-acetyltransferase